MPHLPPSPFAFPFPPSPLPPTILPTPPSPPPLPPLLRIPAAISYAFSTPPFTWNAQPLRIFRSPTSLSDFAKSEEANSFLGREHKYWYKILRSALDSDLLDLKRRHAIETSLHPSLRAIAEREETARFHKDFMDRLQWGRKDSPLLLRPGGCRVFYGNEREEEEEMGEMDSEAGEVPMGRMVLANEEFHKVIMEFKRQGQESEFPSIRAFFAAYPGPSVAWTVQDFYRRQVAAREAAKIALEFQQMWEWSERHWNFFEAASKLRIWVSNLISKQNRRRPKKLAEYEGKTHNWTPAIESHKRRHQWSVLKRIMAVYEARDETPPVVSAPAGKSLDRYFGRYGKPEGWYPVDRELDAPGYGDSLLMRQIDGAESALEAGGSLVEACVGVVDGCMESTGRGCRTSRFRATEPTDPPSTLEEAEETLVRLRVSAESLLRDLESRVRGGSGEEAGESSTMGAATVAAIEVVGSPDTEGEYVTARTRPMGSMMTVDSRNIDARTIDSTIDECGPLNTGAACVVSSITMYSRRESCVQPLDGDVGRVSVESEGPPDPMDMTNGDARVNTEMFMRELKGRLVRAPDGHPESRQPVEGWLTGWRNPRAQWPSGLKA